MPNLLFQTFPIKESANDQVKLLVVDPDDPTPPLPLSQWLLPASTAEHRATVESFLQRIAGLISFPSADAENMPPPPAGYSSGHRQLMFYKCVGVKLMLLLFLRIT